MTAYGDAYGLRSPIGGQAMDVGAHPTPVVPHCPSRERPDWLLSKFHCTQDHELQRRYGITCADYWGLFELQGGRCAICHRRPGPKRRLVVDHDHDTGTVDGLVHFGCNRRLTTVYRRYLAGPPGRRVGLVVPAAKLQAIEARYRQKQTRRKQRGSLV